MALSLVSMLGWALTKMLFLAQVRLGILDLVSLYVTYEVTNDLSDTDDATFINTFMSMRGERSTRIERIFPTKPNIVTNGIVTP